MQAGSSITKTRSRFARGLFTGTLKPSRCHMAETSPAWFMVFLQKLLKGRSVSRSKQNCGPQLGTTHSLPNCAAYVSADACKRKSFSLIQVADTVLPATQHSW
jgi:hypothetical protein